MTKPIVVEHMSTASAESIYEHLINSERWVLWQGVSATLQPSPGGLFRMETPDGRTARGQFIDVVPNERVVFSWGWTDMPGLPPGSSTVEIDLIPTGQGTLIRLCHRGLAPNEATAHEAGWRFYLGRLSDAALGKDLGPDTGPGPID